MRTLAIIVAALLSLASAGADEAPAPAARVAWYATWDSGRAAARRTGRPIVLIAATPHCHYVSGLW